MTDTAERKASRPPAQITDEGVAELRRRIGKPEPNPVPPHYRSPDEDTFRIVANAYGDDNPLWCDPGYAATTRWGGAIASPVLVGGDTLIGEDRMTDEEREDHSTRRGDPLRGVHAFYAASEREWWAPLRPGRRIERRNALVGVLDKPSDFAGRAIHEWTGQVFQESGGPLLAGQYRLMARTERSEARKRKKNDDIVIAPYANEQIDEIEEHCLAERPRGAEPRFWEDVEEGDELGRLAKGPLTVTDMICWHVGMGMGVYGVAPLRLAHRNRRRIKGFYHRDELNIPDVMQRVHWDPAFAQKAGNPTTFDYGRMRETWMIHLCTDWMGDDAWLWRLRVEFRKFNFVGDTQWVGGRVTRKYVAEGDRPAVDVDVWCRNQRDELTTPGSATILLPSRERGEVRLPEPPDGARDLGGALQAIAGRFERR